MRTERSPAETLPHFRLPFCCGCFCTSKPAHWSATHGSTCMTAEPRLSASGYLNGYIRARTNTVSRCVHQRAGKARPATRRRARNLRDADDLRVRATAVMILRGTRERRT